MTPEERFERIENNLLQLTQSQITFERSWNDKIIALTDSQTTLNKAINELTASVTSYVDAATTRMAQMEANLDALIRLITAEHSNGKGGLPK
jgi:flagellar biosynthesis chaperone FliJ